MKVAINTEFGEFCVSRELIMYLREKNVKWAFKIPIFDGEINIHGIVYKEDPLKLYESIEEFRKHNNSFIIHVKRNNKDLIKGIETLGFMLASGNNAVLKIVTIPNKTKFEILSYEGIESIHEKHRVWD